MALCKAAASYKNQKLSVYLNLLMSTNMKLPTPFFNVINGGEHAGNYLAFQEFMIVPFGAKTFEEAVSVGCEVYQYLKKSISKKYGKISTGVGDEGGFAPPIKSPEDALSLLQEAINELGYQDKVGIALDIAASEFFEDGKYHISKKWDNPETLVLTRVEYIAYLVSLVSKYPGSLTFQSLVISIEDPFDQDDLESWKAFTNQVQIQVVGDDLTVTNPKRIRLAVEEKLCNALLLKVNQIGTISESIDA